MKENLQDDQKKFLDDNPDFDYDQDVKDALKYPLSTSATCLDSTMP